MQITIDTETASNLELLALSALIGVLSGRTSVTIAAPTVHVPADAEQRINDALNPVDHSDQDAETVNAAVAAGAPTHDSAGVPWDERIHSASRATVADGTWRRRKNTPQETYDAVMAELIAGNDTPPPPPSPEPSETPAPPAPSEPVATATPVAAAAPAADVPPPPADGPDFSTFAKFVQAVNNKPDVPAEKKAYAALNELCATFGVAAFKDMKDRPNDWEMFYEMVG